MSGVSFSEQFGNQINPTIGLSLSIPIFQRKQVKNQVAQATILADNYQLNLIDTKNNLRKAVEQACTDAAIANITYQASLNSIRQSRNRIAWLKRCFRRGLLIPLII